MGFLLDPVHGLLMHTFECLIWGCKDADNSICSVLAYDAGYGRYLLTFSAHGRMIYYG